jgi:polyhydroxyalkanoate synthesis repressor PhaR
MKLIKRYKNRRLYDTELKRSITFDDIKSYVMEGIDVKIVDNVSGDDITVSVLSSIMAETANDLENSGVKIINAILKKKGAGVMDVLKKITLASIGAVNLTRERAEEIFDELIKKGEASEGEKAKAVKEMVDRSVENGEKVKEWVEETYGKIAEKFSSKVNEQISELSMKLEQLNGKIADLERKLNK